MRIAGSIVAGVATAVCLAVPMRGQQPAAPMAPDTKTLIFELANSMGMLRSLQREDSITTFESWAKGTMTVGQQRFDVPEYRMSINYSVPGMRIDYRRAAPGGQAQRAIEVVSGGSAWNEADRGKGATPARDRLKERLVYLWTTPMGIVKAATMAGARATVKNAAGAAVLSFPLPAPANDITAHATVRRDASLAVPDEAALKTLTGTYIVSVATTGPVAIEATYAEYGDWNWPDYQSDVMTPHRMTRKQGDTTLELTTVNTNTYNPYVIMPVPENVR